MQLTFTIQEHKDLTDFMNLVANKAEFNGLSLVGAHELSQSYRKAALVVKKIEDHIMEVTRVTDPPKED